MKTHFIPLYIGVISLAVFHGSCFGDSMTIAKGMEFSLIDERSVDSSPKVMVTFPDGYKDSLVLRKNHFDVGDKMEVDEGCNYIGHLEIEKDACVAMTGCFGSDDIEFTIMSRHATGSTGFVWTKEGEIHTVDGDKKFVNGVDTLRSNPIDDHDSSEESSEDSSESYEECEDCEDWSDGSSIEDDKCLYLNTPPTARYNIKAMYSDGLFEKFGRNTTALSNRIKAVFAHLKAQFCHPSLGTKININLQNPNDPLSCCGKWPDGTEKDPEQKRPGQHVKTVLEEDTSTHLVTYLYSGGNGGGAGTGSPCNPGKGGQFVKSICGSVPGIYYGAIYCAGILRHELGHSLGMGHTFTRAYPPGWDCGPEGSIMGGNDIVNWNPCGVMDFRRMYTQYSDNWCLPEDETACTSETEPEGMSYFQIKNENGYVLEHVWQGKKKSSLTFSPNGLKDSQFWYLYRPPFYNNNGYGFIGSKKYFKKRRVLAISLGDNVEENANMLDDSCSGGCKIVLTSARDIQKKYGKEFQLWKVDGMSIRSQFNDAVIGVGANGDGESPLSAYIGYTYPYTGLDIVSIDPVAKSNYTSPIEDCPKPESFPNGQFDIRNDMTGEFLISVEKPSSNFDGNVIVTDASSEESWVWEPKVPKAGSDLDVWGFIRGEHGYLTATCGKRDNSCKVGLKKKFDKYVVDCGNHREATCADCPKFGRKCKGDCEYIKQCESKDPLKDSAICAAGPGLVGKCKGDCKWVGRCSLKPDSKPGQMSYDLSYDAESVQLWRVMNGKIISKHRRNLKRLKPAVLTLDSEGTVAAMNPNTNKDQSWTLVKKE